MLSLLIDNQNYNAITVNRHGPKPGSHKADTEASPRLDAEALTLVNLEAEALVVKPKPKPGYL